MTPQEFSSKWADARLKERAGSQEHFIDVCRLVGSPTPADVDKTGEFFTFERGVVRGGAAQGGRKGFADVWLRGKFSWEYKGPHKNLVDAYAQLQLYREDLENPPLSVVCDMDRFEIHTNFDRAASVVHAFTNEDVGSAGPEGREAMRVLIALFSDPDSLRPGRTREGITEEVAAKFALLADGLRGRDEEPHRVAHFLMRLVFCMFAEDVGLLPEGLFGRLIDRSVRDPAGFASRASELFGKMAHGGELGYQEIRHFNGGLFADDEALDLKAAELRVLAEAARLDWSSVEPAIFGTLFERSLDPERRSQRGEHYTGKDDVLRVVEPVLVTPLRREWDYVRADVESLVATEHPRDSRARTRSVNRVLSQAQQKLNAFVEKVRATRVLDPACGSGNFLYVSLNELLDLEKEVSVLAGRAGLGPFFPEVSPDQLYGVEVDPYARELTQVSIWIGYLQWMKENGFGSPPDPILGSMTNVVNMDAILVKDENGYSEPEWPEADIVVGNPPFLGSRKMRSGLGTKYCDALKEVYDGRVAGLPDLVCYWFEKSRALIEEGRLSRAGLIATQAIRNPANRKVLKAIKQTGDIFMAWSDRDWVLDGASVHVSIVGFDGGAENERLFDGELTEKINADLTTGVDLSDVPRLKENDDISFQGVVLRGAFQLDPKESAEISSAGPNPNGRPNSDVVRPLVNGQDLARHRPTHSVVDFGVGLPLEDAALYEAPFEHVRRHVYPERQKANQRSARETWWIHWNPRRRMREELAQLSGFIATPTNSKHRIFVWLTPDILPDHQVIAFAREDDYFFGVLHSRPHEVWSLATGTQLREAESGFRYTPTECFRTFPFPWVPGEEPNADSRLQDVEEAARLLALQRKSWLGTPSSVPGAAAEGRTLTDLYNDRPPWLTLAHTKLDRAVFACYGWKENPEDLPEQEMLERLLDLNGHRAGTPVDVQEPR